MKESRPNNNIDADPCVRFAAERTLLAWIRTALGIMPPVLLTFLGIGLAIWLMMISSYHL